MSFISRVNYIIVSSHNSSVILTFVLEEDVFLDYVNIFILRVYRG